MSYLENSLKRRAMFDHISLIKVFFFLPKRVIFLSHITFPVAFIFLNISVKEEEKRKTNMIKV